MNPIDFILDGGAGGISIAPSASATATSGQSDTSIRFGNSGGLSWAQVSLISAAILAGAVLLTKGKK